MRQSLSDHSGEPSVDFSELTLSTSVLPVPLLMSLFGTQLPPQTPLTSPITSTPHPGHNTGFAMSAAAASGLTSKSAHRDRGIPGPTSTERQPESIAGRSLRQHSPCGALQHCAGNIVQPLRCQNHGRHVLSCRCYTPIFPTSRRDG